MLLLVTVGLVLAGLILLIVGFVQDSLTLIYLSIACAAVAGLALIVFSRLSRRSAVTMAPEGIPAAAASPSPLVTAGVAPAHAGRTMESTQPASRPPAARAGAATEPREPVGARRAADTEEDRFDPGEPTPPQPVRAAPVVSAPTTRLEQARTPEPVPAAAAAGASDDDEWEVDWGDEVLFPIEDYDELRVAEIVPLLPELDPDELEEVRDREAATKNRASILARIDELMGNTPPPAPVKQATRKAPAARSAPSKASAATSKPAPAKKAAAPAQASASKAPASKAAASKAAEPAKTAAAKATRSGAAAGSANAVAKKAPAKSAPAAAKAPAPAKKAAAKEAPAKSAAAKKASPTKAGGAAKKAGASKSQPRKRT